MKKLGYKINAKRRVIEIVTIKGLSDMQKVVGGNIETAHRWKHDDCYVNEDGLFNDPVDYGFRLGGNCFVGNGLVIGHDGQGDIADSRIGMIELATQIEFLNCKRIL